MSERLGASARGRVLAERLLETHLVRVLFALQREHASGVLTVEEGPLRTHLSLVDGRVVFADAGAVAETLGRVLLRAGKIDRDEYELILERMAEPSDRDAVHRFGDVALSLGMLSLEELHSALGMQVRSKLERCLQLDDAEWSWAEEPGARVDTPYPVPLEPALLEALRSDSRGERWAGLLAPKRGLAARLAAPADEIARLFAVTPAELRLLVAIDGQPLGALLASASMDRAGAGALLATLVLADLLELDVRASVRPPAQPADLDEPAAREPEVPHGAHPASDRDARARAAAAQLREEMRRRGAGPPPSPQRMRVEAERTFLRGKRLLAQGALEGARAAFESATALLPEAADYALHAMWCRYVGESDPAVRSAYEVALRSALIEAIRQDRTLAFAHYVQGRLSVLDGDDRGAERAFATAVRLDPSDVDAARYLHVLRRRHS